MEKQSTPLIQVSNKIWAKLETYQPTGSVKDRMINYLVKDALKMNKIKPGFTRFVEATSGNTGISLAAKAAKYNCPCTIIMPRNMSKQRRQMMEAFGACILDVDDNDFQGAITLRDKIISSTEDALAIWCPYQFENPLNIVCHFETTADEICCQVADKELEWGAFIHGAGTGGTMMGIKRYIDHHELGVECVLTVPAESAAHHGIQGINDGADFLLDRNLMNTIIDIKTNDAIKRMEDFWKETGLLVGISSGANILAAEKYVEKYSPDGIVITILCDRGERYL